MGLKIREQLQVNEGALAVQSSPPPVDGCFVELEGVGVGRDERRR